MPSTDYANRPSPIDTSILRKSDTVLSPATIGSAYLDSSNPVSFEQISSDLVDICINTTLINKQLKDNGQFMKKVEDLKDEYMARKENIKTYENSYYVQKWLYEMHRACLVLNNKLKKIKSTTFMTADGRKQRCETRFADVNNAWSQLMMNITLIMTGKLSEHPEHEVIEEPKEVPKPKFKSEPNLSLDERERLMVEGDKYLFGYGVNRSYDTAFKKYLNASKQGSYEALNMIGCLYEFGLGREIDLTKAFNCYLEAAQHKFPDAINNLGRFYESGKEIAKDLHKAFELYSQAADLGHQDAQTNLGYLYENGIGTAQDTKKAAFWYKKAAEKDYARAQNCLGNLYFLGKGGLEKDYGEAVKWFRKAVAQGNSHAQNNLGVMYEQALGVSRDYAMAKQLYKSSSEGNHPTGTNNLGYLHLLKKEYPEAIRMFYIASALGSVDALFNLGTVYESGISHPNGTPDYQLAYTFYSEAAERSYEKAQIKLAEFYLNGHGTERDIHKARDWLEKCATLNNAKAQYQLGKLYEDEFSDSETAQKWFSRSEANGYEEV